MQYRSEIDGLRALAIVPVIFFHAGFETFAGGFLGVDVFFVISGFLITSLLHEQIIEGRFSFRDFYERRIRRLFPALFVVVLASVPFAWMWIPPEDFIEYAQSLIAVALFIANFFFHAQSGYFDTAAELKPFLHNWSLSIEEQYYFIFPALLLLMLKLSRGLSWFIVLMIALTSFAASQTVVASQPSAAFFHFHLRVWELLIGSGCALWARTHASLVDTVPPKLQDLLAATGLIGILLSMLLHKQGVHHPGWATWIPVLGTALVLVFSGRRGYTGHLLSWKPLVGIGLLSYGAYLWHQPLFALVRQKEFSEPSAVTALLLIALTFALAIASLKLVEEPIRSGRVLPHRRIFLFWGAGTSILLALGAIGMERDGWSQRFNLPDEVKKSLTDHSPRGVCVPHKDANGINAPFCWLGADAPDSTERIAVFGDSHAFPITAAFHEPALALRTAVVQAGIGGCLPFIGGNVVDGPNPFSSCSELAERQLQLVKRERISRVFLVARWSLYTSLGYAERKMYHVAPSVDHARSLKGSLTAFESALKQTVEAYRQVGAQVFLVSQLPQQITHPLSAYLKVYARSFKGDKQAAIDYASIEYQRHIEIQAINRRIFDAAAHANDHVRHLVLDDLYCSPHRCRMGTPETAYYSDLNHISTDGALLARDFFKKVLLNGTSQDQFEKLRVNDRTAPRVVGRLHR